MLQQLQSHLAAAVLEDYMALPSAAARCAAFQETAQALVFDVLMLKARSFSFLLPLLFAQVI